MLHVAQLARPAPLNLKVKARIFTRLWSSQTAKHHDPLNILFCGADEFSIYSLRALHRLQHENPRQISSIDVLCRPDKRVGRGLKHVQEVPIKGVANELGLNLHQIDTFKSWFAPDSINLVVAVSFGLLVPARILTAAKYGGLNVHPSLLPDLRGPAPIVHTLLKRRSYTGVTLQTMHPTKFDHGRILLQSPLPGVPVPPDCRPDELLRTLGPIGAALLCQAVATGEFLPPWSDAHADLPDLQTIEHAPKIMPEDRRLHWHSWTAEEVVLRDRVLGQLWDMETYFRCFPNSAPKRIIYNGPWTVANINNFHGNDSAEPGMPILVNNLTGAGATIGIATVDGKLLIPTNATVEGEKRDKGLHILVAGLKKSKPC